MKFELPAIVKHFKGNMYCAISISKKVDGLPDIDPTLTCKHSENGNPVHVYKLDDDTFVHSSEWCLDDELVIYRELHGYVTYVREKNMFFSKHPIHGVDRFESITKLL